MNLSFTRLPPTTKKRDAPAGAFRNASLPQERLKPDHLSLETVRRSIAIWQSAYKFGGITSKMYYYCKKGRKWNSAERVTSGILDYFRLTGNYFTMRKFTDEPLTGLSGILAGTKLDAKDLKLLNLELVAEIHVVESAKSTYVDSIFVFSPSSVPVQESAVQAHSTVSLTNPVNLRTNPVESKSTSFDSTSIVSSASPNLEETNEQRGDAAISHGANPTTKSIPNKVISNHQPNDAFVSSQNSLDATLSMATTATLAVATLYSSSGSTADEIESVFTPQFVLPFVYNQSSTTASPVICTTQTAVSHATQEVVEVVETAVPPVVSVVVTNVPPTVLLPVNISTTPIALEMAPSFPPVTAIAHAPAIELPQEEVVLHTVSSLAHVADTTMVSSVSTPVATVFLRDHVVHAPISFGAVHLSLPEGTTHQQHEVSVSPLPTGVKSPSSEIPIGLIFDVKVKKPASLLVVAAAQPPLE